MNYTVYHSGDQSLTVSFGDEISLDAHKCVMSVEKWFKEHPFQGMLDVVIAFNSVAIIYDAWSVSQASDSVRPSDFVKEQINKACLFAQVPGLHPKTAITRIPVCYEDQFAPDMEEVARFSKLSIQQVIDTHSSQVYHVYMIGFLPGFAYMGSTPREITIQRKPKPEKVNAGGVGLAGNQTGIYPVDSPGGWHIIGCTPWTMFDKNAERPSRLLAGDRVTFFPVTIKEFLRIRSEQ